MTGAVLGGAYSSAMPASNRGILATAPAGRGNFAMGLKQVGVTAGSAVASLVITGLAAVVAWQAGFWIIAALAGGYAVGFVALYDGTRGEGTISMPDFSVLRSNHAYLVLVGVGFFMGASIFAMLGYIVLYVVDDLGHSTLVGGVVLALTQVMGSAARIGAGSAADRLGGARGAATVALVQMAGAVVLFAVLATGVTSFPVALVVFAGLGLTIYRLHWACSTRVSAPSSTTTTSARRPPAAKPRSTSAASSRRRPSACWSSIRATPRAGRSSGRSRSSVPCCSSWSADGSGRPTG